MNYPGKIKEYTDKKFKRYGLNKRNQIARLLYEISARDNKDFRRTVKELPIEDGNYRFDNIKEILLKKRYPSEYERGLDKSNIYIPKLKIDSSAEAKLKNRSYSPSEIYFEKSAAKSDLFENAKALFPDAKYKEIVSGKSRHEKSDYGIKTYNNRRESLFILNEKYDFIKDCPCTQGCLSCDYKIFNLGFGCPYECTYCYLQSYTNTPGIMLPANLNDYFKKIENNSTYLSGKRIGSGEFTDSLALDHITGYSKRIIGFFKKHPDIIFEFKTKSDNIENLLKVKSAGNIVISWSLNPQNFIDKNEFYSASLEKRLEAASKCSRAGYSVGFHFDPVVPYLGYRSDYREVIELMFEAVNPEKVRWISIGSFRFPRSLKRIIENRFPESSILNGELMIGFDGKLRYSRSKRAQIYKNIIKAVGDHSWKPYIYLCMEPAWVWEETGLKPSWRWK